MPKLLSHPSETGAAGCSYASFTGCTACSCKIAVDGMRRPSNSAVPQALVCSHSQASKIDSRHRLACWPELGGQAAREPSSSQPAAVQVCQRACKPASPPHENAQRGVKSSHQASFPGCICAALSLHLHPMPHSSSFNAGLDPAQCIPYGRSERRLAEHEGRHMAALHPAHLAARPVVCHLRDALHKMALERPILNKPESLWDLSAARTHGAWLPCSRPPASMLCCPASRPLNLRCSARWAAQAVMLP